MGCNYGSLWRKWDFHVHTPYSILNNNYGFNPFEMEGQELETAFDEYVIKLFSEAVENNIAAIGITDYFMIEGYKRIKNQYLTSPEKMEACFPDAELRDKVKKIFVFPNIELRLDTFVGKGSASVNYHVIFSDAIPIDDIEQNFLNQLEFKHDAGGELPLTLDNIKKFGKTIKENNGNSGSDLLVGLENVTISYDEILKVLRKNPSFEGTYIIAIPVDEDLSKIEWAGRDYQTRRNLYKQAHVYLTSNQKTVKFALAKGEEESRIKEFGSIKPCIWGSDAHEYDRMFRPSNDSFCWLKAEPTFEGLLQILYEPGARVHIQSKMPGKKDAHQIIDSIQFLDDNFPREPIVFNDSLTCIIGGKSTGKSLLLRELAWTIDSKHVEEQERTSKTARKPFVVKSATVLWKDGTTDARRIVYIPQTYLNKTIDNPEESTAITRIVEEVLLQEPAIKAAHDTFKQNIDKLRRQTKADIQSWYELKQKTRAIEEEIKREGASSTFATTIKALEMQRTDLAGKVNISQAEIDRFGELEKNIQAINTNIAALSSELYKLKTVSDPVAVVPGYFQSIDGLAIEHYFGDDFPKSQQELLELIDILTDQLSPVWKIKTEEMSAKIGSDIDKLKQELVLKLNEYDSLKGKVAQSEQLQELTTRITLENSKYQIAVERETQLHNTMQKLFGLRTSIAGSQEAFFGEYAEYGKAVRSTGTKKDTELRFDAQVVWKCEPFISLLSNVFNNKNFSPFRAMHGFDLSALQEKDYGINLLEQIWDAMDKPNEYGGLTVKSGNAYEKVLQQLFDDWYNIHYLISSGNDTIEEMSPGKKALVLLELLISLEDSKCPILIDQPEDDLDNRSIYYDLVQFIRKRKEERQIIIVTHNANVVLGADAEEVIVANQDGKDTENQKSRFEYRSGAIENDEIPCDELGIAMKGILNKTGIQTQICDILEGGKIAFQLRQNKYAGKKS